MSHSNRTVEIFDTTLRDGSQLEGISLSVEDKLRIAQQLDRLGVQFIEGGWPGANPKDSEFFLRAKTELHLTTSTLVAFGSTRRAGGKVESDPVINALLDAGTDVVCIVAKAWDYHVHEALRTTEDEAIAMIEESVAHFRRHNKRVFVDAEHFFDGFRDNREFAMRVAHAVVDSGAERLILCDTNGGTLPDQVEEIVAALATELPGAKLGSHFHDDSGCAVANSLAAVRGGALQVQGCMNGYGERTGNANLTTLIPNLSIKMGIETIPPDRMQLLFPVAHHIAELVNVALNPQQPYVGMSSFAHKAGLHTSALARRSDAYEHVDPKTVGNSTRFVVSELAGRSTVQLKAQQIGLELDDVALGAVLNQLKDLENRGYHFEVADGSLELLLRRAAGLPTGFFTLDSYRVTTDGQSAHERDSVGSARAGITEATVRLTIGAQRRIATAEGNGPVNALDRALRSALEETFPCLRNARLSDFRVRVLDSSSATGAITRVLIDSMDEEGTWTTIGVSENIIEASCQALMDSIEIALLRSENVEPEGREGTGGSRTQVV